jgi:pimeloyl-ACP methyl ester carboxylesterase
MSQMPLFWDNPDGKTLPIYVKRLKSSSQESEGQLWLLHGGPGASGLYGYPSYMETLQKELPAIDIYTIDHRGTGYSHLLSCPRQESKASPYGQSIGPDEYEDCIAYLVETYGDELAAFSTTNAAKDLGAFIDRLSEPSKKTFVWGGSYGSFLAERYLQLFHDQASGVIIEGIAPPTGSLIYHDEANELAGAALMELCTSDPYCSAKLGNDPTALIKDLYQRLDEGYCLAPNGIDTRMVKSYFWQMLYYTPYNALMPALIYRMDRCNDADKEALTYFHNTYFGREGVFGAATPSEEFSVPLYWNVSWSELWATADLATVDEMRAYLETVNEDPIYGLAVGPGRVDDYVLWPKYSDPIDGSYADTQTPMLMMQGMLDPATGYKWAKDVALHFNKPNQSFVAFPYSAHNAKTGTYISADPSGKTCGMQLFNAFIQDPQAALDLSCVSDTLPPNFKGSTTFCEFSFGTADCWETLETSAHSGESQQHGIVPFPIFADERLIQREALLR